MARFLSLIAIAFFTTVMLSSAHAFAGPPKKAPNVNYDDPNMAFTPDYATDTAVMCPKTLKGRKLRACLLKNGLATSEEISEGAEILNVTPPSSFH